MIMVDTSVIIEILRKTDFGIRFLNQNLDSVLLTSEICIMELYFGLFGNSLYDSRSDLLELRKKELESTLNHYQILPFDRKSAIKTAQVMGNLKKSGKMIDFRDGMIAGISLANGISRLVTLNTRHFGKIRELNLIKIEEE